MLRVAFTDHARERMRERGIPAATVIALARCGRPRPSDKGDGSYRVLAHRSLARTKRRLRGWEGLVIHLAPDDGGRRWVVLTAFVQTPVEFKPSDRRAAS
jgi:hypothetical protein